jgi:hypothetical protein
MGRTPATPVATPDAGLVEIDRWAAAFSAAQFDVINSNPDLHPDERMRALVAAEQLATAVAERMRDDYLIRRRQAPR